VRRLLLACIFVTFCVTRIASASPLDPIPDFPKWTTPECLTTIGRITQHEVGDMDEIAWRFLASQVMYDVRRLGCENLTQWRWAIGAHSFRFREDVAQVVMDVVMVYPNMAYPRCQFVGSLGDIRHWKAAGYRVSVDYRHSVGGLTVIGVNCE